MSVYLPPKSLTTGCKEFTIERNQVMHCVLIVSYITPRTAQHDCGANKHRSTEGNETLLRDNSAHY